MAIPRATFTGLPSVTSGNLLRSVCVNLQVTEPRSFVVAATLGGLGVFAATLVIPEMDWAGGNGCLRSDTYHEVGHATRAL